MPHYGNISSGLATEVEELRRFIAGREYTAMCRREGYLVIEINVPDGYNWGRIIWLVMKMAWLSVWGLFRKSGTAEEVR